METWKQIPGYELYYEASDLGRIRSMRRGKILATVDLGRGYLCVNLSVGGKAKLNYIHRLVAKTFISLHIEGLTVNHLNGEKGDNRLTNIELVSIAKNIQHACETGLRKNKGENNIKAKLNDNKVRQIRAMLADGKTSISIARLFNVEPLCIGRIKCGLRWAHVA